MATPTPRDDLFAINENTARLTRSLLANDRDPDGDILSLTGFWVGGAPVGIGTRQATQYGWVTVAATGELVYELNRELALVNGLAGGEFLTEVFRYQVSDGLGGFAEAQATIRIDGRNDTPILVSDAARMAANGGVAAGTVLTTADFDPEGDVFGVTGVRFSSTTVAVGALLAGRYGTLTVAEGGAFTYTVDPANAVVPGLRAGQSVNETFTITVTDALGAAANQQLVITIDGVNEAPVAVDDARTIAEGSGPITGNVLSNDSDPDRGDVRTVAPQTVSGLYGRLELFVSGVYTYVLDNTLPAVQALGVGATLTETFDYTVRDTQGATDLGRLTITIEGRNDAPIVTADTATVVEDEGPVSGDVLRVTSVRFGSGATAVTATPDADGETLLGRYGALTLFSTGGYTYVLDDANPTVNALRAGQTLRETFVVTVGDRNGGAANRNLTITIEGAEDTGDALVVRSETLALAENGPGSGEINLLANDFGTGLQLTELRFETRAIAPGQPITGALVTLTPTTAGGYRATFDPTAPRIEALLPGQSLTERFSYTVTDAAGATRTATLTVRIDGADDPVRAANDAVTTLEDTPVTFDPRANDFDELALGVTAVDGRAIAVGAPVTLGDGAVVSLTGEGRLTYAPAANASGVKTFSYTVGNSTAQSDEAVVVVDVRPEGASGPGAATIRFESVAPVIVLDPLEVRVNSDTTSPHDEPAIAALSGGGYVVTWTLIEEATGSPATFDLFSQIYTGSGESVGSAVRVGSTTGERLTRPSVAGSRPPEWWKIGAAGGVTGFGRARCKYRRGGGRRP